VAERWSRTRLTELLGIRYPIVQAPMASISTAPLVGAVSESGAFGSLGSALLRSSELELQVERVRALTERPFGWAVGTLALVPQIVDAVSIPVIAAGGIADGRGIAAALALGASGVQLGTAFFGCGEAQVETLYRRTLLGPRAAHTQITSVLCGRPARAISTRFIQEMAGEEGRALDFPLQRSLTAVLAQAGMMRGDLEFSAMCAAHPRDARGRARGHARARNGAGAR
jgi:nitronate monooxygenase